METTIPDFVKVLRGGNHPIYLIQLNTINYNIYQRHIIDGTYSSESASLATEKTYVLENPKVLYYNMSFYMNKVYPHVYMYGGYSKKINNERFGKMCLGHQTLNACDRLVRAKRFEDLKIKLEDRLTTAAINDCYLNYRALEYDENNVTLCKFCHIYIYKNVENQFIVDNICINCSKKAFNQVGLLTEELANSVKQCGRCSEIHFRFKKCKSRICSNNRSY